MTIKKGDVVRITGESKDWLEYPQRTFIVEHVGWIIRYHAYVGKRDYKWAYLLNMDGSVAESSDGNWPCADVNDCVVDQFLTAALRANGIPKRKRKPKGDAVSSR